MLPSQQVQNLPTLGHLHYFHIIGVTILSHCRGPLTDSLLLPLTVIVYSTRQPVILTTWKPPRCSPAQKPAGAPHSMQRKRPYKAPRDLPPTSLLSPPPALPPRAFVPTNAAPCQPPRLQHTPALSLSPVICLSALSPPSSLCSTVTFSLAPLLITLLKIPT